MYSALIDERQTQLQSLLPDGAKAMLRGPGHEGTSPATPAVACFVDLARFTTISEALGRAGSAGTEKLVTLINRFFTPAIDYAYAAGGDVVAFGGDALTVTFPIDRADAACGWASALMALTEKLEVIETETDRYSLEAKIGIGQGQQVTTLVGTGKSRRVVVGGTAVDNAVKAEGLVEPGQIGLLLDRELLPGNAIAGDGLHFLPAIEPADHDPADRPERADEPADERLLMAFAPARVIDRLLAVGPELLDEHRPTTVLFLGIGTRPIHDDPKLGGHLELAMEIIERQRGSVISIGSGDKGTTVVAAFGAPMAFDGQRSAAIFAANEISVAVPSRSGVSSGLCFCGRVGSDRRWSYTLMGDVVNTAARLMTEAGAGQVLVDQATYHAADPALQFAPERLELLKGKEDPVRFAELQSVSPRVEFGNDLPLTGRERELQSLADRLDAAAIDGIGSATMIVGDSGVGKTRLLRQVMEEGLRRGFQVAEVTVTNRRAASSYGPWREAILAVLGLASDAGPAEFEAAVVERLGDRGLLISLIRESVSTAASSSAVVAGMEPDAAAEVIDGALVELVLAGADRPLLLVVDDAHDLDEASARVLNRVCRQLGDRPVVVVAISYPGERPTEWDWPSTTELADLTDDDALTLITDHRRKAGSDLDDETLEGIVTRVGGNPQLLRLLADYAAAGHDDLPNDARSIVLARYDRLPVGVRETLAKASVLGRHFDRADYSGAFTSRSERLSLLDDLTDQRLLESTDGSRFSFASPLLWQVAYEANSHASRARAHHDVGLHIERRSPIDLELRAQDLAHHFGFTDDVDRHRRYYPAAARRAQRTFANEQAVEWFERAVEVAEPAERPELQFEFSSTLERMGQLSRAASLLRQAVPSEAVGPRALASLAHVQLLTDNFELADKTLREALQAATALRDPVVMEWVLEKASLAYTHAGRYQEAADLARRQLEAAQQLGDGLRIAAARSNLGAAQSWIGDLGSARKELTAALELLVEVGALGLAADTEMDLAMVALDGGQVDECIERLHTVDKRATSIGYRRVQGGAATNLALALFGEGRVDEASEPARRAAGLFLETGDLTTAAAPLGLLGALASARGQHQLATALVARTVHIGRRVGTTMYRDRAYQDLINAYRALGAQDAVEECERQRAAEDAELSDEEVDAVAPLSAAIEQADHQTAELLAGADRLLEKLGGDDG